MYRDKLKEEKWKDYQKGMTEHLDEAMKNLTQLFEQQMRTFVIHKMEHLQGVVSVYIQKVALCAILYITLSTALSVRATGTQLQTHIQS